MANTDLVKNFAPIFANAQAVEKELTTAQNGLEVAKLKLHNLMLSMSHHNLKLQDQDGR